MTRSGFSKDFPIAMILTVWLANRLQNRLWNVDEKCGSLTALPGFIDAKPICLTSNEVSCLSRGI